MPIGVGVLVHPPHTHTHQGHPLLPPPHVRTAAKSTQGSVRHVDSSQVYTRTRAPRGIAAKLTQRRVRHMGQPSLHKDACTMWDSSQVYARTRAPRGWGCKIEHGRNEVKPAGEVGSTRLSPPCGTLQLPDNCCKICSTDLLNSGRLLHSCLFFSLDIKGIVEHSISNVHHKPMLQPHGTPATSTTS